MTSFDGHKYITVMIDVDVGYITAAPIDSFQIWYLKRRDPNNDNFSARTILCNLYTNSSEPNAAYPR